MDKNPKKSTSRPRIEEDRISGKIYDRHLMGRLLAYGRPYWPMIVVAVLMIIGASALQTVGPYLTKLAIDRYITPGDLQGLPTIAWAYVGLLAAGFAIRYFQVLLTQYLGQKIIFDLRTEIFAHLQNLHQQYFDRNPVGRLMTRVTSDVESLNQVFTNGLVMIFGDIFLILGIVVMMLSIDFELALWVFSVIPFLFVVSFIFRKKVRIAFGEVRFFLARINAYLQERISGMSIVQVFNREKEDWERFSRINWDHTDAYIRTIFYYAVFWPVVEVISAIALALILFRGGWMIESQVVTIGVLVAFIQYARMFFRPISDLSEKYNVLQSAFASSERIFKLLDTHPAISSPADGMRPQKLEGAVEFQEVSFAYENDFVLRDINLNIAPGERVALVGHTGSGKTTLVRLLGRFYDVQKGRVCVDGIPVQNWDLPSLRSHMAVVPQEVFLFSDTILNNIRLGKPEIPEERVREAARLVNAAKFIEKLPEGYQTRVSEGGSNLSVGQKQLLGLARALVTDPEILLLDEATANIDSESEALIQSALERVLKGRTAIVIAHRLSTIQRLDRIVVMHRGEIREQGSHQDLLKKRGLYYKLYQLQYQPGKKAAS
ncbi:MAG TPA: ABC transporter ATP-binding protein [Calditrichia bacterium]|nr:ABC transporter ATP-binding protein [Calditrichota bacterium]HQV33349.1 ABC transporter ATP-binding protein [Calditrichia bacterium]